MNTDFIKGVIVPIITVIDEEEKINEAAMRAQVDYVINGGLQRRCCRHPRVWLQR